MMFYRQNSKAPVYVTQSSHSPSTSSISSLGVSLQHGRPLLQTPDCACKANVAAAVAPGAALQATTKAMSPTAVPASAPAGKDTSEWWFPMQKHAAAVGAAPKKSAVTAVPSATAPATSEPQLVLQAY
jgi:hypothetical protein